MNFFKSRMDKLRDTMKRHRMRQISVWVPKDEGEWLRGVFARVGENTVEGQVLRDFLRPTMTRRRPPGRRYETSFLTCEIDGTYVGVGNEIAPIGGRLYNTTDTLIELPPQEAQEIERRIKAAIGRVLANYAKEKSLTGKVRNTTGVITDRYFLRDVEIDVMSDEAFERSETATVQSFVEHAFSRGQGVIQDESIFRYLGFGNAPSRCQIVEVWTPEGDLFVAFIHIKYGGTSPTNMIEMLCDQVKRTRHPDVPLEKIKWLDVYPGDIKRVKEVNCDGRILGDFWAMESPRYCQVTFREAPFTGPTWNNHHGLPDTAVSEIKEAIHRRIDKEALAYFEELNLAREEYDLPKLHFVMPKQFRENYPKFHADILIEDSPEIQLIIALFPVSRPGKMSETGPMLAFSEPGYLEHEAQPESNNLAQHWPCLRRLLDKPDYGWDDEDFQQVCEMAQIPWRKAMAHFKGQTQS